jgi:DNA-binding response OmpR family regulator
LTIDLAAREVAVGSNLIALTAREFDLLAHLASRPLQVLSRAQLLRAVWDSDVAQQDPSTVTVHVRRLRMKLDGGRSATRWIDTVVGVGYRFDPVARLRSPR